MTTTVERFWSRVDVAGPDQCWLWTGARTSRRPTRPGYGELMVAGKMVYAHRYAYALVRGPIPAGMIVMHRCDNGLCVNPWHLSTGTHLDNSRDMVQKGRAKFVGPNPPRDWHGRYAKAPG